MVFWIIFTLISFFGGFIAVFNKNPSRYYADFYVVLLWFIASFRYNIGADYSVYEYLYYVIDGSEAMGSMIYYIIDILHKCDFNSQMLFVVYETIIIIFTYLGIRYYAKDERQVVLALLIYAMVPRCYFNSMNQIRQAAAISIIFWSSKFIIEKNFRKYIGGVIVASLFHLTASFFILLYYWKIRKIKTTFSVICIILFLLLGFLSVDEIIINKILSFIPYMDDYVKYALGYDNKAKTLVGIFFVVLPLYLCAINIICNSKNIKAIFLLNMTFLGLCIMALVSGGSAISRFRDYFLMFFSMGIGICLGEWIERIKSYYPYLIVAVMSFYFLYSLNNSVEMFNGDIIKGGSAGNIEYEFNFNVFNK